MFRDRLVKGPSLKERPAEPAYNLVSLLINVFVPSHLIFINDIQSNTSPPAPADEIASKAARLLFGDLRHFAFLIFFIDFRIVLDLQLLVFFGNLSIPPTHHAMVAKTDLGRLATISLCGDTMLTFRSTADLFPIWFQSFWIKAGRILTRMLSLTNNS